MVLPRIRERPVAIEDSVRVEERVYGSFLIKAKGPGGLYITDNVAYRTARVLARRRTQYHESIVLSLVEPYDPPALD